MESLTLQFWCWVHDADVGRIFPVEIARQKIVGDLKKLIKNKKAVAFRDIDAHDLDLYYITMPDNYNDQRLEAELKKLTLDDMPHLSPLTQLSNLFKSDLGGDEMHLIIIKAPTSHMTLSCWVRGHEINRIFSVEVARQKTVTYLKDVIKNKKAVEFRDVDADQLALYKSFHACDDNLEETLNGLTLGHEVLLRPTDPLSEVFPELPPGHVHIVIEAPLSRGKCTREEADDDVVELPKRAKFATDPPSRLTLPQNFRDWHRDSENPFLGHRGVRDYKPFGDEPPHFSPISLQYEGFGHFLDIFRGREGVPGVGSVSYLRLRSAVDNFAEKMSPIYHEESARMFIGLAALNSIFSARTDQQSFQLMPAAASNRATSNGHIIGPHKAAYCVTNFKNESGNVAAIPYVEMTSYFAHTMNKATGDPAYESSIRRWNFPCLGMTIVGPCVTFYAMIYFGRWRVISLTPGLSCIRASGEGDDRTALYAAFTAASVLLVRIKEDAARLVDDPPAEIRGNRVLPRISSLSHPDSGTRIEFKIVGISPFTTADRLLYIAQTTDGKEIIVKFTRRYSSELHTFCADQGCAPALLGCERLPGGFFGVAMEYIKSAHPITESEHIKKHGEWAKELHGLVKAFHAKGLVHGDLRWPNIICDVNGMKVIDFDWGGRSGEVSYPDGQLNPELTEGRENGNMKITKDDDLRVLRRTLKYLGLDSVMTLG